VFIAGHGFRDWTLIGSERFQKREKLRKIPHVTWPHECSNVPQLWEGNTVLLRIIIVSLLAGSSLSLFPQNIPYGSNDAAGHYVQSGDARIYYEQYGNGGTPLVLLHGGVYGYIDEFGELINVMSKHRTVIAIATRGYGRSELGKQKLSQRLFAEDAATVIRQAVKSGEKVDVLGFSEGAGTSYLLAAKHPDLVNRLIAIGGSLGVYGETLPYLEDGFTLTPESLNKQSPEFFESRRKLMAHPEQWQELIHGLDAMYREPVAVRQDEIKSIAVPTLIMAGDRDDYTRLDHFLAIFYLLPKGQLSLIPGCGHVVLSCKGPLVIQIVSDFLQ
jgi:pimeloyl-ACP methyl ester carboxylesterase